MKTDLMKPQPSLKLVIKDLEETIGQFNDLSRATCSATVIENIVARLKQIESQSAYIKIWHRCDDPNERPEPRRHIILRRDGGYIGRTSEYLSAQYYPEFRPLMPWLDFGGNAVTDDGADPLEWAYPEDLFVTEVL